MPQEMHRRRHCKERPPRPEREKIRLKVLELHGQLLRLEEVCDDSLRQAARSSTPKESLENVLHDVLWGYSEITKDRA